MLPKLLFVHVPKTGGVALYDGLKAAYGVESCIRFGGQRQRPFFDAMPGVELQQYRCVVGHISLPDFLAKGLHDWAPVAVVRDPIERLLSAYHYRRTRPQNPRHAEYLKLSLDDFIDLIEAEPNLTQLQLLAGVSTLAEAQDLLSRYRLLAPHSEFAGFTAALGEFLGCSLPVERRNETAYPADRRCFTPAQVERLNEILREDIAMYQWVKANWRSPVLTARRGRAHGVSGEVARAAADRVDDAVQGD